MPTFHVFNNFQQYTRAVEAVLEAQEKTEPQPIIGAELDVSKAIDEEPIFTGALVFNLEDDAAGQWPFPRADSTPPAPSEPAEATPAPEPTPPPLPEPPEEAAPAVVRIVRAGRIGKGAAAGSKGE